MKLKISNSPTQNELEEIDLSLTTRRGVEYLIGRSPDSDLVLDSEDVSRHHGKFFSQSGNYYFSDLGSRNGTIINGKVAQKDHSYILKNGDIIHIGDFALIMEEDIAVSQQSETVVRIIQPEMFSNRKGSQNGSLSDVATPSEFINQSQESQPVINESIADKIEKDEECVNTSEELTFVQSDEAFPANADIVIPDNAVELHEDNEISDAIEEATANTTSDKAEYTIVQTRDVLQEDKIDSEAEEIAVQTQEEKIQQAIIQEDDINSEAEEIVLSSQEEDTQLDDIDSEAEEIVVQTHEEDTQQAESETTEVVSNEYALNTPTTPELGEELVSETASISTDPETEKDAVENISEESVIEIAQVLENKQIVLISHDTKKSQLTELIQEHEEFLSYCLTRTWQTFSDYLYKQTGLSVTQEIPPATSGGYQAINSLINSKEIIAVIFLRDFITPQPGQASEEALLRTCNINEILLATNLPTAQAVIHFLKNMKD